SNCSDFSAGLPHASLCSVCGIRPRLATLSRCRRCIGIAAEQDRDTRTAAATRVTARELSEAAPALAHGRRKSPTRPTGESPAVAVSSVAIQGVKVATRLRAAKFGTCASDVAHPDDLEAITEAILASPEAMAAMEEAAADLLRPSNDRRAQ